MGRRLPVPTAIVATVAFVAVTLSACSGAGPLTPATSEASRRPTHASPPPGGSGPPPSGDCVSISAGSSRAPWTIESIRTDASAVVVGTLTARDPARWTTADGQRPVMSPGRSIDAVLWTPLVLADGRTIFGDVEGRPIGVIGGTSGCDSYSNRD